MADAPQFFAAHRVEGVVCGRRGGRGFGRTAMRCEEAQQLFNAYLDGELSPSLTTELDAHRLQCGECRRSLAILEVTGHVLSSTRDPVALKEGFTDRLLACVDTPARRRWNQIRRYAYIGGPLAAAAVIALAFLGVFDRGRQGKVAGLKVEPLVQTAPSAPAREAQPSPTPEEIEAASKAIDEWVEQMRASVNLKRQSGESLQKALDLTILQVLDILEQYNDRSAPHFPGADVNAPFSPDEPPPLDEEDVEDL